MCFITFSKREESGFSNKLKKHNNTGNFTRANIGIVNHCSHKCNFCYGNYFNEKNKQNISIENFDLICKKLKSLGIIQIGIIGGEPLEHPYFKEILEIANYYGFIIHISTNGELLDNLKIRNTILENNIDQIQFNYQGKEIHDILHGKKGSYEKMIKGLNEIKGKIRTVATIVLTRYSLLKIDNILSEIIDIGFDRIRIWDSTGLGKKYLNYDIEKLKNIYTEVGDKIIKLGFDKIVSYETHYNKADYYIPCPAMKKLGFDIKVNGDILFCATIPNYIFGNIFKDNFDKIIKKYNEEIEKIKTTKGNICISRGF